MRTTIELSDEIYARLRARAAARGMRGFSALVEEAVERMLDQEGDLASALAEAEGAWSQEDIEQWERAREEAWASWQPAGPSSTPMS